MKNKHIFNDYNGHRIIIEHEKPFTRFQAFKILSKNLRNRNVKRNFTENKT